MKIHRRDGGKQKKKKNRRTRKQKHAVSLLSDVKEKLNGHDNKFKQCTHFENRSYKRCLKGGFDLNETCRALLSQTDTGVRDTGPAVRTNWAVSLKRGELHYGVAAVKSGVYGQVCSVCLIFNGEIAATRGALINCFPRTPSPSSDTNLEEISPRRASRCEHNPGALGRSAKSISLSDQPDRTCVARGARLRDPGSARAFSG